MSICRVVLASGSPRRHQLLNLIGIEHEVNPANIDETLRPREAPRRHAERMLGMLSGREHTVITAVAVARGRKLRSAIEEVRVKFRRLREDEIEAYIATGEPMDKAGAYGIQGFGATIVERIEGDYFAVMGLPLVRLVGLMRDVGVRYKFGELATSAD